MNKVAKDCGCTVEIEVCDDGTFYPIAYCPTHNAAFDLKKALAVIQLALREDKHGQFWDARELATCWGMFHDDLSGNYFLAELARIALEKAEG